MFSNRRTMRIEWGDCDPAGIVYYPRYVEMLDCCTNAMFEAAGYPKPAFVRKFDLVGYPMVELNVRYMIPSTYGDDIDVVSTIANFGTSSFVISHKVYKGDALAIEATEKRVLVGKHPDKPGALKSRPIPQEIIDRFERG